MNKQQALAREYKAAAEFKSRWTLSDLRQADERLHKAVVEQQRNLNNALLLQGDEAEIVEHAEAMGRGWYVASEVMRSVAAVRRHFPGARVIRVRIKERGDDGIAIGEENA